MLLVTNTNTNTNAIATSLIRILRIGGWKALAVVSVTVILFFIEPVILFFIEPVILFFIEPISFTVTAISNPTKNQKKTACGLYYNTCLYWKVSIISYLSWKKDPTCRGKTVETSYLSWKNLKWALFSENKNDFW